MWVYCTVFFAFLSYVTQHAQTCPILIVCIIQVMGVNVITSCTECTVKSHASLRPLHKSQIISAHTSAVNIFKLMLRERQKRQKWQTAILKKTRGGGSLKSFIMTVVDPRLSIWPTTQASQLVLTTKLSYLNFHIKQYFWLWFRQRIAISCCLFVLLLVCKGL